MKKEDIVFALYVTVAVVNITYGVTEVYKTFKKEKKETAPKVTEKTN